MQRFKTTCYLMTIMIFALVLAGCSSNGDSDSPLTYEDIPATGDAERGERLFRESINRTPTCIGCHTVEGEGTAASPGLEGYGEIAGQRVEGESAREYSFWSIVEPGRYVVEGYGNVMYDGYGDRLSPQDIADLIEYMLSL